MMRKYFAVSLCWFALQAACALAILPPDAEFREPQLRAARIRMRERYDARQLERQAMTVREYRKTEAAITLPPWERERILKDGSVRPAGDEDVYASAAGGKKAGRLGVALTLLLLIGGGVLVARHLTRETEEQNA